MSKFVRQFLAAVFLLSFIVGSPTPSHATHSWGGFHWARSENPFTVKLGDNVSSAWDPYLGKAATDWSVSGVLDAVVVAGGASNAKTCKATTGRVEVCATTYGNNGWLGLAQIWISGSHITKGAVKMNDTYFRTAKYNTSPWRNMVMCQEVGHTLGLDHQDEIFNNYNLGTCMDYTNFPEGGVHNNFDYGPANQAPGGTVSGDSDYDELVVIYGSHFDSAATVKKRGNNNKPAVGEDGPVRLGTAQWGRLIRSTNHGRTELFELDLGRGNKVFTHVIWADPE